MDRDQLKGILENLMFVSDGPIEVDRIASFVAGDADKAEITEALNELKEEYQERSLEIAEVAEGWRIQTRPEYAPWITMFYKMERGQKLSRASLETLAITAYRQPITRTEIDEIRGVDCGGVLRGLIDKTLVKTMGRRKVPGKPMMYGTTKRFLEYFGLAKLADLPTMDEFQEELDAMLSQEEEPQEALEAVEESDMEETSSKPVEEQEPQEVDTEPNEEMEDTEVNDDKNS
ncbi:Segregation and condensation protein B [hydrothermal vent metagenome]|uniref:Segregation and condensation protein B n=1 Tax=hydrothermal vent metagenome TaxID=652676 RepID=A0A3B1C1F5_9ZZZZ